MHAKAGAKNDYNYLDIRCDYYIKAGWTNTLNRGSCK